jgi:hypothetical protein
MTKQDVNSNLDDGIEEIKLDDKTTKSKDKDNKLNNVTDEKTPVVVHDFSKLEKH